MKLRLLCMALAMPFLLLAQTPLLSLKTGEYLLPEGIQKEAFVQSHDGLHYGLLQVNKIPTNTEKRTLTSMGLKFLDYLPENVYQVSFPVNFPFSAIEKVSWIRTLMPHAAEYKTEATLLAGNFPNHALLSPDIIRLNLELYPNVNGSSALQSLRNSGVTESEYVESSHVIEVIWAVDQIDQLAQLPYVSFVAPIDAPLIPENKPGRSLHRSSTIDANYGSAMKYDGSGVVVALNDDGIIGPHVDYQGRIDQRYVSSNGGDHGDHVGGIIAGAGNKDPDTKGMAPGADMFVFTPSGNAQIDQTYYAHGIRITSTSYGSTCNGGYTSAARTLDIDARNLRSLVHVYSAGNSGTSDCGYGAGSGWGNITGGHKAGKNVIAVGNMTETGGLASSSSRGPSADGRIKPDICAVGTSVYSTIDVNDYGFKTGTSMSCPGISGITAQLFQAYKDNNGGVEPDGGFIKSLMMNTAEDKGNVGPDFRYGWGRVNARKAAREIENGTSMIDSVSAGGSNTHTITVPAGLTDLKVMVYWTDKEGSSGANNALVNNLDITLSDGTTTHLPWVLDHAPNATSLNTPAITGTDNRNNVEQVALTAPAAGTYTLTVNGTSVPFGPQRYYVHVLQEVDEIVVTYPIGGEAFDPADNEYIRWDAPKAPGNFTFEYSVDNGVTWQGSASIQANRLYYNWNVPNTITDQALVRITRGAVSDVSDTNFYIAPVPAGLSLDFACPDSMGFSWNAVTGISEYEVSFLGAKYMDSVGRTTTNSIVLYNQNPFADNWISVRSILPSGAKGRRAIAINPPTGLQNCPISEDLAITKLVSPGASTLPDCIAGGNEDVVIEVTNNGVDTLSGLTFSYQLNGGAITTDPYAPSLAPGASINFTFSTQVNLSTVGVYDVKAWVNLPSDGNHFNDTISEQITIYSTGVAVQTVPFVQNFDNFSTCGTSNDCGATVCNLQQGFLNYASGTVDDFDFRTNNGSTPSTGTGPSGDNTSGNGNYVYVEASGTCEFRTGSMVTPCIDLSSSSVPELSFYYHMVGSAMGNLYVDLIINGQEFNNVWQQVGANNGWTQAVINLLPYVNDTIQVRFRAETGSSWQSDIAIDDIQIIDNQSPPTASFSVVDPVTCLNTVVDVVDASSIASSWNWVITPGGAHSFVNGTSATSQNISLSFSQVGSYDVKLVVSNAFGADSVLQTSAIEVTNGLNLPISNDFESVTPFEPFTLDNPDNDITWATTTVVGPTGANTTTAFMDNYNYNAAGQLDYMVSSSLDLSNLSTVLLTFDVAYAPYSVTLFDGLAIEVSSDCGETWSPTAYDKSGAALATAANSISPWSPSSAADWRNDTLDLSSFGGSTILIRFKAICGYGNGLYIDNIVLEKPTNITSAMGVDAGCVNQPVVFYDSLGTSSVGWNWDFGSNATPTTATGPGPHNVSYANVGPHNPTLTVWDATDTITLASSITLDPLPTSSYSSAASTPGLISFTNNSVDATSYSWTFGDGGTSTDPNPTHQYASNGTFTVTLIATNACGQNVYSDQVSVNNVSLSEALQGFKVFPNPVENSLSIEGVGNFNYVVYDLAGAVLLSGTNNGMKTTQLDLSNLPQSVYLLEINLEGELRRERIVKTN